jgi:hypothetical protein
MGRFVDGQAEDTVRMGSDVGEGDGAATGVPVEMESRQAGVVSGPANALNLHGDVVVKRGRTGPVYISRSLVMGATSLPSCSNRAA